MLVGVQFDAGGADRQEALLSLAKVGDELIVMIGTLLLIKFEGPNMIITALVSGMIPEFTHIGLSQKSMAENNVSDVIFLMSLPQPGRLSGKDLSPLIPFRLSASSLDFLCWIAYPISKDV